jgi:selenocysteine lyase/cysteine desulfurase
VLQNVLLKCASPDSQGGPSLFAMTGLSNISNHKAPLDLLAHASELGYATLLDAAALAATSRISLRSSSVDAMAVSFYKISGYPTGVGALVAKKSFLKSLRRPWFAGKFFHIYGGPYAPTELIYQAEPLTSSKCLVPFTRLQIIYTNSSRYGTSIIR